MRDFSKVHAQWRDTCLNCALPDCVFDLDEADPRKAKCPVYRQAHPGLLILKRERRPGYDPAVPKQPA